jgi:hypothetical protein
MVAFGQAVTLAARPRRAVRGLRRASEKRKQEANYNREQDAVGDEWQNTDAFMSKSI